MVSATEANSATGFASQNGGTYGGLNGKIVHVSTGTEIHSAICSRAKPDTPLMIQVEGTITQKNTTSVRGNCQTADDAIQLKDISNVSIVGVGKGALFEGIGIHIRASSNIVLQNLHIKNVKKTEEMASNGGDAINLEANVANVWVDHCTLETDALDGEVYDGLFDMKNGTRYVTLSYSVLKNSARVGLVGSGEGDDSNNYVTYHHNYFSNIDSRVPLVRHATVHVYNNYFSGINKSGINPRAGGRVKVENNYIENALDPLGTFYTNEMGYWQISGNFWGADVSWSSPGHNYHPAGPDPVSNTTVNIPYAYLLDDAICLPKIVLSMAGANKGLQYSDGSCPLGKYSGTSAQAARSLSSISSSMSRPSTSSSSASSSHTGSHLNGVSFTIEENQAGFCSVDGKINSKDSGFSGSGFADTDNSIGNGVNYALNAAISGNYNLSFTYANGSQARSAKLIINNAIAANLAFDATGSWTNWKNTDAITVYLGAGNNVVRLEATQSTGLANIDKLTVYSSGLAGGICSKK